MLIFDEKNKIKNPESIIITPGKNILFSNDDYLEYIKKLKANFYKDKGYISLLDRDLVFPMDIMNLPGLNPAKDIYWELPLAFTSESSAKVIILKNETNISEDFEIYKDASEDWLNTDVLVFKFQYTDWLKDKSLEFPIDKNDACKFMGVFRLEPDGEKLMLNRVSSTYHFKQ